MSSQPAPVELQNPYPGLRPFDVHEFESFFGRDRQVDELLGRLRDHRFVAVVGLSGSGKSSLVRAGLIHRLEVGHLTSAGSRWRMAVFRPGSHPIDALAAALDETLGKIPDRVIELRKNTQQLLHTTRSGRGPGENLLLVVDQFEEVFRYQREELLSQRDAAHFVDLLLAAEQDLSPDYRTYVVLTMRTDYQGDCAQFEGLPEALNRSQYLVPRLTRDQTLEAIVGPAALVDTEIAPDLLRTLLVESAEGRDTLPLLQHALIRLCEERDPSPGGGWQITLALYKTLGGMGQALNDHADDVLAKLPREQKDLAKKIFQQLTEVGQGRDQRRPMRLSQLVERTEGALPDVKAVVEHFLAANFLTSPDRGRAMDWEVDISHESLIRQWETLSDWAKEEAQDGDDYLYFAKRVERGGELLTGADFALALEWRDRKRNEAWSQRYGGNFTATLEFIERSREEQKRLRKAEDKRRLRRRIALFSVPGTVLMIMFYGLWVNYQTKQIQKNKEKEREVAMQAKTEGLQEGLQQGQTAVLAITQGLTLAREGDLEAALKQFQTAGAANPTLPVEVLDRSIADAQRKSEPSLKNLTVARRNYLDYRDTLPLRGLAAAKTGDFEGALNYFSQAGHGNPMSPIKFLDQAIFDAESKNDPMQSNFKVARQDYMNQTDPFSQTDLEYRDYACKHSAFVVAASEPESKVEEEVKRWQQIYPTASGGVAGPGSPQVQIIAASFLTCQQARNLRDELNRKKLSAGAFLGSEYSQCSPCSYHAP
jgi:tetratricopeptide (TPR) repeat protein